MRAHIRISPGTAVLPGGPPEPETWSHHKQDVIFDGTMMWAPFVEQTIAMVRDHRHKYRRGPGYHKSDGCNLERCAHVPAAAARRVQVHRQVEAENI